MPRAQWPLHHGRPSIRIFLTPVAGGQRVARRLLADTGAGSTQMACELLLEDQDCLSCGGPPVGSIRLGQAFRGPFPLYTIRIQIPELGFDAKVPAAGIIDVPRGFHGLAAFRFLNRFTCGNFGDPGQFGLEP
jgi:hypothetical protein